MAVKTTKLDIENDETRSDFFLKTLLLTILAGTLIGAVYAGFSLYKEVEATQIELSLPHMLFVLATEIAKTALLSVVIGTLFYFSINRSRIENPNPKTKIQPDVGEESISLLKQKLERKERELEYNQDRLGYANELFNAAFYSNSQLQSISDFKTGQLVDVNKTWVEVRGISREEAIGKTADELNIWGGGLHREKLIEDINELGRLRNYETVSVMRTGEHRDFIINAEVIYFRGKKLLFFSGLDITDQKKIRLNLQRAQKLDAVGLLTGGIAHDFNNLLAIILGNLELANELTTDNPKLQKLINSAIIGTERGVSMTDKLLSFSGGRPSGKEVTQINPLLEGMKELIAKSLTASIQVETTFDPNAWPVEIDPSDLEDVIINLTLNAQDAMSGGGKLVIETYNRYLDQRYVDFNPMAQIGEHLAIRVTDTGFGIDEDVKDRIFEPFFTTKDRGKGTGLGLSMVFGFVKRSGGHIRVDSKLGHGTSFTLLLPRSRHEVVEPPKKKAIGPIPQGTENILIVEDEIALSDIATSTLNKLGYVTHCAPNGSEALTFLENNPAVDLVFSDVVMPGTINGFELAAAVRNAYPTTKILLTSGFSRADTLLQTEECGDLTKIKQSLLGKPYNRRQLANAVRQAIDET